MPAYAGPGQAQLLLNNRQAYLFVQEFPSAGSASVAYMLDRVSRANHPIEFAIGVNFNIAPGTFEIDIEGAEIDMNANYVALAPTLTTVNASNAARFSGVGFCPKFVRLRMVASSSTGAVCTAVLSR